MIILSGAVFYLCKLQTSFSWGNGSLGKHNRCVLQVDRGNTAAPKDLKLLNTKLAIGSVS